MDYVPIDVLQTIVAHAPNEEPGANIGVLFSSQWVLALTTSIDVECGEVAREFATILSYESPLWEFFLLGPLNVQSANLVAPELKPEHVIRQVQHQMVLLRVLLE